MNNIDELVKNYKLYYPSFYKDTTHYIQNGKNTLIVFLADRTQYEFHSGLGTIKKINKLINDEKAWRSEFSYSLLKKMHEKGFTEKQLAERSGISYGSIYNYLQMKSTPSYWNVLRIAKALDCDIRDLEK